MRNRKVYVRVDGGDQIGLGHLIRCFALAKMLQSDFQIIFACQTIPEKFISELAEAGFVYIGLGKDDDFFELIRPENIVVLDGYHFDSRYQKLIKQVGCKLVCIDDLYDKVYFADLIINHAPGVENWNYNAQVYTQYALGLDYALLRTAFLNPVILKSPRLDNSILICFGGSDGKNLTVETLKIILATNRFGTINVITGESYLGFEELEPLLKSNTMINHYHSVDEYQMAELIAVSNISVVPSSGILMEVLVLGNIIISGMYVENQKYLFENFKKMGAFISAEDFSPKYLKDAIAKALNYIPKSRQLIDGKSGQRIIKLFKQLTVENNIKLRRATSSDLNLTYKWAVSRRIRAFSFNQAEIGIAEHSVWFRKKIADNNCFYYIAEMENAILGSIRFDIVDEAAIISYLLDPNFHNQGLSVVLIKKGIIQLMAEKAISINSIVGFVMLSNIASLKAFAKLGFRSNIQEDKYKFILNI